VQRLAAADAGQWQGGTIASMLRKMSPEGGHILQRLAAVGALARLPHLRVLELVFGQDGR